MMINMMTRMITVIVASLASLTAVMITIIVASLASLHHQCCLFRDVDDHDDNGTGAMIVTIRVMTTIITTSSASLLVP